MNEFKGKKLKRVERQIWWIETKIGWLRFVSGRPMIIEPQILFPMMYFVIIALLFILYVGIDHFFIPKNASEQRAFVVVLLILLSWYMQNKLDKKVTTRIEFLNQKLNSLYQEKSNLSNSQLN